MSSRVSCFSLHGTAEGCGLCTPLPTHILVGWATMQLVLSIFGLHIWHFQPLRVLLMLVAKTASCCFSDISWLQREPISVIIQSSLNYFNLLTYCLFQGWTVADKPARRAASRRTCYKHPMGALKGGLCTKLSDPTFSRFSRTPTCDRRTDRQTDTRRQLISR